MNDTRNFMVWLGRVLANSLAGGLAFAIVGAFCGGLTGFVMGLISDGSLSGGFGIAFYGALAGIACGFVGILVHLIAALTAPPDDFWQPFFDLTPRVAWGQLWGTVVAITAFYGFELVSSQIHRQNFVTTARGDGSFLILFAPAMMIFGAIAAAVLKRD